MVPPVHACVCVYVILYFFLQTKIKIETEAGLGNHIMPPKRRKSESNLRDIPDEQVTLKVITITG